MATRNEQFTLHAYVCGNACLQEADVEGTVSFFKVFMTRPMDCRYAIATRYSIDKHGPEVVVFDLFAVQESVKTGQLLTPEPIRVCDSVDAAIMATFMLYEDS